MKKIIVLLMACLSSGMSLANHWTSEGANYSGVMSVYSVIQIDGIEQYSDQLEVGAFCGDECRGSAIAGEFYLTHRYLAILTIYGETGHQLTFKLYDHNTGQEYEPASQETITFIEDGYGNPIEPYILNFTGATTVTYTLPIAGYGSSDSGYYLIATPIDDVNPATIAGMTTGHYDLYYFDQSESEEWRNYKDSLFSLESGKGYLYAHKTVDTLTFTGTPYSGNGQVTLSKTEGTRFAGWNLVGNPFPQTAYIGNRNFYVMKADGSEIIAAETDSINAMQGIFVIAENYGETLTFSTQRSSDQESKLVLNVLQSSGTSTAPTLIDRAIVRFDGDITLPKLMLNHDNTKIYIPNDDTDYAVMKRSTDNITPVNFKANYDGNYTLRVDIVNLKLDYLHLIDDLTGADIDLLDGFPLCKGGQGDSNPATYTFKAKTTDPASRFRLVYSVCGDTNDE